MLKREEFWAWLGGGSFLYLLGMLSLYGKKRGTPEYWLKRGWKAGRKGKDWKKPFKACTQTMSVTQEGPLLPSEAIEWCGSVVATGHAAGAEGVPFKQVALPALPATAGLSAVPSTSPTHPREAAFTEGWKASGRIKERYGSTYEKKRDAAMRRAKRLFSQRGWPWGEEEEDAWYDGFEMRENLD